MFVSYTAEEQIADRIMMMSGSSRSTMLMCSSGIPVQKQQRKGGQQQDEEDLWGVSVWGICAHTRVQTKHTAVYKAQAQTLSIVRTTTHQHKDHEVLDHASSTDTHIHARAHAAQRP